MKPDVIFKFAKKILDCDEPSEAISISNIQLPYFSSNEDFVDYFFQITASNLIYSSLIYFNFNKLHSVNIPKVEDILVAEIRKQATELRGTKIDLSSKANTTTNQLNSFVEEINRIADLSVADLLINSDESLHYEVFGKTVRRIRSREDGYGLLLNRCGELLSHLNNSNRCIYTIRLISKMIYTRNDDDYRVLSLIIKSLSNRPLHFYSDIYPQVVNCILKIISLNDPFVLQQLLDLFPQINFSMLSMDLTDFLRLSANYPNNRSYSTKVLRLIACAETLNSREEDRLSEQQFRTVVYQQFSDVFEKNKSLKETVELRFICKSIADDATSIDNYLISTNCSSERFIRAPMDVELAAFNALVRDNPTKTALFLKWLGDSNAYKLNFNVRNNGINYSIRIPGLRNTSDLCNSQLVRLSTYCSDEDLVFIYFNSHIRVYLPIEALLRLLYEKSSVKRDDYMTVNKTFRKYIIDGILLIDKKGEYHFTTEQFLTKTPHLTVSGYERISKENIKKIRNENGGKVHFTIESFNVAADFNPQITLLNQDKSSHLTKNKREIIEFLADYLEQISERRVFTSEDVLKLSDMPINLQRTDDYVLLGMKLIRCCYSFNDNMTSIDFLKHVTRNPFRINTKNYSSIPMGVNIGETNFQFCLDYVKQIIEGNGAIEDWLFLYFNTILRSVYYFDSFLARLSNTENLDLWMLYDAYEIKMHGKILSIDEKNITIHAFSFKLSSDWSIIYPKAGELQEYKESDIIAFDLYDFDSEKKIIYAENISKAFIKNKDFCTGMNKAKLTLELDSYDIHNLQRRPIRLNQYEFKELAINEILAIKLRISDFDVLYNFLSMIYEANPWSFSEESLPCIVVVNDTNKYLIESTINDLIDNNTMEYAVSVYFNTSLRSAFTVDSFIRILVAKYKDINKINTTLSQYTIVISGYNKNTDTSSNVYLDPRNYLSLQKGSYSIVGYNKNKRMVELKIIE